ncbi:MAG: DUF1206 domain-containing protein [Actinomycetota bacterium]|nr:MAG: DUF1206 domain-containing protein [Actinomycetota bacterium]
MSVLGALRRRSGAAATAGAALATVAGAAGDAAATVAAGVDSVGDSRAIGWAARAGLVARGVVYLLLGLLALLVARGAAVEVDQKGALAEVVERPFGGFVVGAIAVGLACYAAWRLSEAATGVDGEPGTGPRLKSLIRGVLYAGFAVTAVVVLLGSTSSQAADQATLSARLMQSEAGRWLVIAVGAAVAVTGVIQVVEGIRSRFMRYFPAGAMRPTVRRTVHRLGQVGTIARGLVFMLAGGLVCVAGWTYDASRATGLDGAMRTLLEQPYGGALLVLAALGLMAFGCYGLAEARYRRV